MIFLYATTLFPSLSTYSIKPTFILSSIVPYFSTPLSHFEQYLLSITVFSHCVYKPWFFTRLSQQPSTFTPENGITILLFSFFSTLTLTLTLTLFSFLLYSIFSSFNTSSFEKLYFSLQYSITLSATLFPNTTMLSLIITFIISQILSSITYYLYLILYLSFPFQFFLFFTHFFIYPLYCLFPPLKRWSQTIC